MNETELHDTDLLDPANPFLCVLDRDEAEALDLANWPVVPDEGEPF